MLELQCLRLGTRPSPLATYQSEHIATLVRQQGYQGEIQQLKIASEGDVNATVPLSEIGGKGVFIKSLEAALLKDDCDIAVHSLKDVTAQLAEGTSLCQFYTEGHYRDCIAGFVPFAEMTHIASSSLRRRLFLKKHYPHLECIDIRGNVGTRIQACEGKKMGVMLSEVGLIRLKMQRFCQHVFEPDLCIPAPGQGYIALQAKNSSILPAAVHTISDEQTAFKATFYMDLIKGLNFSCQIPLGAFLHEKAQGYTVNVVCGSKSLETEKRWEESFVISERDRVLAELIQQVQSWYAQS